MQLDGGLQTKAADQFFQELTVGPVIYRQQAVTP